MNNMTTLFSFNEIKIVDQMIGLYCRKNHGTQEGGLCDECNSLSTYCEQRIIKCPIKQVKPVCNVCTVHCYKSEMKKKIITVMKFSGPRMMLHFPVSAIRYLMKKYLKV